MARSTENESKIDIPDLCIYKIPEILRNEKPAYIPQLISIGPIHHHRPQLQPMQKEKERYFKLFTQRLESYPEKLNEYETYLRENVRVIRNCYWEDIPDVAEKFIQMILRDAVFIVEIFLRNRNSEKSIRKKDYLFTIKWFKEGIKLDLLLLENQLPFFVLEELYFLAVPDAEQSKRNFLHLIHNYFQGSNVPLIDEGLIDDKLRDNNLREFKHLTDLIRYLCIPPDFPQPQSTDRSACPFKTEATKASSNGEHHVDIRISATKLKEAGVSFESLKKKKSSTVHDGSGHEPKKEESSSVHDGSSVTPTQLDITFKKNELLKWFPCFSCFSCLPRCDWAKARLELPQIIVDGRTERIFRNLMACEMWHYPQETYICNYIFLLDSLINTTEDVALLVENEVIVNDMGSDEDVKDLFNGLCKQIAFSAKKDCYGNLERELHVHYKNPWNRTMAKLMSVYFCDLWRGSSTLVGIAVLVLTVFSILHSIF